MSKDARNVVNNLALHPISLHMHSSNVSLYPATPPLTTSLVSATALLFIDWLSTLDVEIMHAWTGRWNLGRILYFATRHSAFVDVLIEMYYKSVHSIPPSLCARLDDIWGPLTIAGISIAELTMTIRVWALWGRRRELGIFLSVLCIVDVTASSAAYLHLGPPYQYVNMDDLSTLIPGCFPIITDDTTNAWSFIPLIIHQTLIFTLTAVKGFQHYWAGIYGTSLIGTFYRDGITYYALLVVFSVVNLAAIVQQSDLADPYFLTFLQRILHSVLSARMLLHLRRESNASWDSKPLTSLKFADLDNESPGGSSPALTNVSLREQDIHDDSWFGQVESPQHRVQSDGNSVEA